MASEPGTRFLVEVSIELDPSAPLAVGASPWRNRRVSDIAGGRFEGPRLTGNVRRSGTDWSEGGQAVDGGIATAIDVRSLWETDDGALIYVTYTGRLIIPAGVTGAFRDPAALEALDPAAYYFRIAPMFETAAEPYRWLNEMVVVGMVKRTPKGVDYRIFEVL